MPEKAVVYIRVSREDEDPTNQKFVISKFCESNNLDCIFFPPEIGVARTEDPFQRPILSNLLKFMEENNIKILVCESVDRLIAEPEYWEKFLQYVTEKGIRLVFVKDARITESIESAIKALDTLKDKVDSAVYKIVLKHVMDSLKRTIDLYYDIKVAVAKEYVEDVRYKVKRAMDKLRNEGKVFHRPTIVHYLALYLTGKSEPKQLTKEEIEHARDIFCRFVDEVATNPLEGSIRKAWEKFKERYYRLFELYPSAARSYASFLKTYKKMCIQKER